jgi:hypothetical protein
LQLLWIPSHRPSVIQYLILPKFTTRRPTLQNPPIYQETIPHYCPAHIISGRGPRSIQPQLSDLPCRQVYFMQVAINLYYWDRCCVVVPPTAKDDHVLGWEDCGLDEKVVLKLGLVEFGREELEEVGLGPWNDGVEKQ